MLIRLIALLGIVLCLQSLPSVFFPNTGATFLQVSFFFILAVLSAVIAPLVLWVFAPNLSKYMASSEDEGLITTLTPKSTFKIAVAFLGVWLVPLAILDLIAPLYSLFFSDRVEGVDVAYKLMHDNYLYNSILTAVAQLLIGAFLLLKADWLVNWGAQKGLFDS